MDSRLISLFIGLLSLTSITLFGQSTNDSAIMVLSTTSMVVRLEHGQIATRNIKVYNQGTANLNLRFFDDLYSTNPLWHQTTHRFHKGPTSWYYGIENQWNYDTGDLNFGYLTSPYIPIPTTGATLTYWQWRQVEPTPDDDGDGKPDVLADQSTLWVYDIGGWHTIKSSSDDVSFDNSSNWNKVSFDLSSFAGEEVLISFGFNTIDALNNDYEGWYLDQIQLNGKKIPFGWLQSGRVDEIVAPLGTPGKIPLTFDATELPSGTYNGVVQVSSVDENGVAIDTQNVNLKLIVHSAR
jgi:hypothetical protein